MTRFTHDEGNHVVEVLIDGEWDIAGMITYEDAQWLYCPAVDDGGNTNVLNTTEMQEITTFMERLG